MENNQLVYNYYYKTYQTQLIPIMCFLKVLNQKEINEGTSPAKGFKQECPQYDDQKEEQFKKMSFPQKQEEKSLLKDKQHHYDDQEMKTVRPQTRNGNFYQFQMLMMQEILNANNVLTLSLMEKNERMHQGLKSLQETLSKVKEERKQKSQEKTTQNIPFDNLNYGDCLIRTLFGSQKYKYQLVLDEQFDTHLYKQRNFDIHIKLVDVEKNIILNSNSIPLSLCVYSSDFQPQLLKTNKLGQTILKGNPQTQIYHGKTKFTKIHLRQVTSSYRNGWIHLLVFPKACSFTYNNRESSIESVIDYNLIKPLVISEVVVRAKKK